MTTSTPSALTNPRSTNVNPGNIAASFGRSLHSEWISAITLRSTKVMTAIMVPVGAAGAWLALKYVTLESGEVIDGSLALTIGLQLGLVVALVFGVLSFTNDLGHGSLATKLVAQPSRVTQILAKASVSALIGGLIGVCTCIGGVLGALAAGESLEIFTDNPGGVAWAPVGLALAAVLGVGVGAVIRHSAFATASIIVWWLIIEQVIGSLTSDDGYFRLPMAALSNFGNLRTATLFAVVWSLVALAAGTAMVQLRDPA